MNQQIEKILIRLNKSSFRNKFHLKEKDKIYVQSKGIDKIKDHAYDFIEKRLAPKNIKNDGKQTPMHGHPVFISQHATATCCRGCLNKWYQIDKDKELETDEIDFVVAIIIEWIKKEMK